VVHRWGGDELLALLSATGEDGARVAARRVVAAVGQGMLAGRQVTVSSGVATLREGESFAALLERVAAATARARARGPGAVVAPLRGEDEPRLT
jgi:PleD family two-component response regulator